jgi:hypothetical protein
MLPEDDDREIGRHWRSAECWCEVAHQDGGADLIDPPWFTSRDTDVPSGQAASW